MKDGFDSLLAEAEAQPFEGWDFSWIAKRSTVEPLSWSYPRIVVRHARGSSDMLDLGTGGGELLSSFAYRPPMTIATEAYLPNVSVAARRLHPLNVTVVAVGGEPDNNRQRGRVKGKLPFKTGSFHLAINRHESYVASEIARVLVTGGCFITQQVGKQRFHDFHRLLGLSPPPAPRTEWTLDLAKAQLRAANLRVTDSAKGIEVRSFKDVGAFAWYLKAIPWTVKRFSIRRYRSRLKELHLKCEREGPLKVSQNRFWLKAVKE
jgi:SAM-dependent methyltransferase